MEIAVNKLLAEAGYKEVMKNKFGLKICTNTYPLERMMFFSEYLIWRSTECEGDTICECDKLEETIKML